MGVNSHQEKKVGCPLTMMVYHCIFTKKHNDISNLQASYSKIFDLLHTLEPNDCFLNQSRLPQLSDQQLIALNLTAESLGIDSERYLFKRLPQPLQGMVERSVYNRRKRHLGFRIEQLRQCIATQISANESHHIIDSMPLEVCRLSRSRRVKVCHDSPEVSPDRGYCAAHKAFDIAKASIHDIHYLNDVKEQFSNCVLIGDKGDLSQQVQTDLFETKGIRLTTPMRRNQHGFKPFNPIFRKIRKRIETLYSQLCDQFMIRRNYAKSFYGFSVRILSKITALMMIQWMNKLNGKPINHLKISFT